MTPVSLNPPPARGPSLQGQNNQIFNVSPNNQDYRTTLLNFLDPRQTLQIVGDHQLRESDQHQGDNKVVLQDGSSSNNNHHLSFNSSSPDQLAVLMDHDQSSAYDTNLSFSKMEEVEEADSSKMGHGSAKWMSSKMRLMKRMMRPSSSGIADKAINSSTTTPRSTPRFQNQQGHENIRYSQRSPRNNSGSSNTTRVCSDCNTSSTPLWRSGPMGPKSLCNACGIRQRKARKAMQEAENGEATNGASTKSRVHNKEKKPRTNKSTTTSTGTTSTGGSSQLAQGEVKKLECFAIGLRNDSGFPMDEASEAALLLMDLSYGFFHS